MHRTSQSVKEGLLCVLCCASSGSLAGYEGGSEDPEVHCWAFIDRPLVAWVRQRQIWIQIAGSNWVIRTAERCARTREWDPPLIAKLRVHFVSTEPREYNFTSFPAAHNPLSERGTRKPRTPSETSPFNK